MNFCVWVISYQIMFFKEVGKVGLYDIECIYKALQNTFKKYFTESKLEINVDSILLKYIHGPNK